MYRLLDKDRAILLQLIYHFSIIEKNYSFSDYAELIDCDRRKIVKLVQLFKFDIDSNQWGPMINIQTIEKKLKITIGSDFSLDFFYSYYMQQSIGFILCWEIFNNRFTTIQQFSNDVFLSRSSVYKHINILKTILNSYDLMIDFSHPKIILGQEHQIRYFFYDLFNEAFQVNEWHFDLLNLDIISRFLFKFQKIYPHFSLPTIIKFRLMLVIYLTRQRFNNCIDYTNYNFNLINILIDFSDFKELIQAFFNDNEHMDEELSFLYFFLTTLDSFELKHFETIDTLKLDSLSPYIDLSKKWINSFCAFFNVSLQPKHYFFLLTNLTYLHHKILLLTGHSTKKYPKFIARSFDSTLSHTSQLSNFYKSLKIDEEFSQLFKRNPIVDLSYTFLTKDIMKTFYPPLNILIYSKINLDQQNWLAELICKAVDIPIKTVTNLSENPDIIISDFPVHSFIEGNKPSAYFICQSFPTKNDLKKLNKLLEILYFKRELSTVLKVPSF